MCLNSGSLPGVMLAQTFNPRYPHVSCPQSTFYQTIILESFGSLKGCLFSGYKANVRGPQAAPQAAVATRKRGLLALLLHHPLLWLAVFVQPHWEQNIGTGQDNPYCVAEIKAKLKCFCNMSMGVGTCSQQLRAEGEGKVYAGNP